MIKKLPKVVRQIIVLLIGIPVIIIGIILLPLPGPGWLVILAGLYIISREVAWAQKYFKYVQTKLRQIADKVKQKQRELREEAKKQK
ncbi:MAG TPA: PGPGW domain-containing protein [Candidatus Polarisedimenticolaceae bacterium]|nr:PGPGW domain-containing protein [Candidatus Polarisedimenticolaceae bacterium]